VAVFDAGVFTAPATKQANELLRGWGKDASTLVLLAESEREAGLSFRNLERVVVLPVQDAGVANIIGASRLLVSEAALPALIARANGTSEEGDK
jgi:large subunit ribosomal protein L4